MSEGNDADSFFHKNNWPVIFQQGVSANTGYIKGTDNLNRIFPPEQCGERQPQKDFIYQCIQNARCNSGEIVPIEFQFTGIKNSESTCCDDDDPCGETSCRDVGVDVVTVLDQKSPVLKCTNSNTVQYFGCFDSDGSCVDVPVEGILRVRIVPNECCDDRTESGPFILACYDFSEYFPVLNLTREEIKSNCNPRTRERTTKTISFDAMTVDKQMRIPMMVTLCRYANPQKSQLCYQLTHVTFRISLYEKDENNSTSILSRICRNGNDIPIFRNTQITNCGVQGQGQDQGQKLQISPSVLREKLDQFYSTSDQFVRVYNRDVSNNGKIFGCQSYPDDSTCHLICPSLMIGLIYGFMKKEYNNPILLKKDFHDPQYLATILRCNYPRVYDILKKKNYMKKTLSLATLADGMHGLPTDFNYNYNPKKFDHQDYLQSILHPEYLKSTHPSSSFQDYATSQFTRPHAIPNAKKWKSYLQYDANVRQDGHVIPNVKSNVADLIIQMVYQRFCCMSSNNQQDKLSHWKNVVNLLSKAETGNVVHSIDGTFRSSDPVEDQRGKLGITELGWRVQPVRSDLDCRYLRCKSNEYSLWCVKIGEWTGVLGCPRNDPTRKTIVKDFCDCVLSSCQNETENENQSHNKWTGSGVSSSYYPPPDHEDLMNDDDDDDGEDDTDSDDGDVQPEVHQLGGDDPSRDDYFDKIYEERLLSNGKRSSADSDSSPVNGTTDEKDEVIITILNNLVKTKTEFVTIEDNKDKPDKYAELYFTKDKTDMSENGSMTFNFIGHLKDNNGTLDFVVPFSNDRKSPLVHVHPVNNPNQKIPFTIDCVYLNADSVSTICTIRIGTTLFFVQKNLVEQIRDKIKELNAGPDKPTSAGFGIGFNFGGPGYPRYGNHRRHYHYSPTRPRSLLSSLLYPGYGYGYGYNSGYDYNPYYGYY